MATAPLKDKEPFRSAPPFPWLPLFGALAFLGLFAVGLAWIIARSSLGDFGGGPFHTYFALPTTFCGFAFGLLLPLTLLRLASYRLRWGRE